MINLHENYVEGLGLELTISGLAVRLIADCAMKPGLLKVLYTDPKKEMSTSVIFRNRWNNP